MPSENIHYSKKEKFYVVEDELYPCYIPQQNNAGYYAYELEVDDNTAKRWHKAYSEFRKTQREIAEKVRIKNELIRNSK